MRSGSSSSRYFAVKSCAVFSGPPRIRTLLRDTGRALMSLSSTARTEGLWASANANEGKVAAAAAESWMKRRLVDAIEHLQIGGFYAGLRSSSIHHRGTEETQRAQRGAC